MLPTILEKETSSHYRDPHSATVKTTHKTEHDLMSSNGIYSKLIQNHQIVITEGVRATQARKRTNPPSSVQYYPTLRYNVLPHPKFAKSPSQAEQKPKGSPQTAKRNLTDGPSRARETPKQIVKIEVIPNDL